MDEVAPSPRIIRFGIFEADLQTAELRKNGLKVPLQGQPFQVFAVLLEHAGQLVTRDDLRQNCMRLRPTKTTLIFGGLTSIRARVVFPASPSALQMIRILSPFSA
jgi:DNA-binding response OmpR family regulator